MTPVLRCSQPFGFIQLLGLRDLLKHAVCEVYNFTNSRSTLCLLVTIACVTLLVHAQATPSGILSLSSSQCVWRTGDNPAWAAPELDEAGWQPYTAWRLDGSSPHIWVRCHTNLRQLAGVAYPALQVENGRAFQAYLNGRPIGSSGDLSGGWYTNNIAPVFPLHETPSGLARAVIALRICYRTYEEISPVRLSAGEMQWLEDRHASAALRRSRTFMPVEACYLAIGFAGFVLLAMYGNDRRRLELLLLGLCCLCLFISRTTELIDTALIPVPWALTKGIFVIGQCLGIPLIWFFFRLAGKRVPWLFRLAMVETMLYPFQLLLSMVLPVRLSLRASVAYFSVSSILIFVEALAAFAAPLVAFWRWDHVDKRWRSLALCSFLWMAADSTWLAFVSFASATAEEATMEQQWAVPFLLIRAFFTLGVIIAMVALLFRDQRRTAEERALLMGEIQAARSVQQVIIPEAIPSIPGFLIESAYKPAGEVGGDFFQIVPAPSGGVLMVIGDVSGKGAPAAMTVSLLVGTFRTLAHYTQSPSEILAAMNHRMLGRNAGGFTTCLVLRVAVDGSLTASNAGHLAPNLDGKEFPLENGLPLGLASDAQYQESLFQLPPQAKLTLITDGIVEARNSDGELFGFDRTVAISTRPVEEIARAAEVFGQEDDIAVLTLQYAPAEVAHA